MLACAKGAPVQLRNEAGMAYYQDEEKWQAIEHRLSQADGTFVYAVKTTGIYCRPSCPSRIPKRENVVFFSDHTEAENAGFRPCKRCEPNSASARDNDIRKVRQACEVMKQSGNFPVLDDLAKAVGLSRSHFHKIFREALGVTPKQYATGLRRQRLEKSLREVPSITQAIYDAGFCSSSRFYEKSISLLGMTANKSRNGAAGLTIRVAITGCFLGHMLVAATDRGICAIEFGSEPDPLMKNIKRRFPNAELIEYDHEFAQWVERVIAFIETPENGLELPLDIRGTAFQERVWKALQEIPPGKTKSYTELAEYIGQPKSVRAVARACAANKIAVAIPCHRAVGKNGDLAGYRWGLDRKWLMLERESLERRD